MSWTNPPLRLRRGIALGSQLLEQRLRLLQICRIKALGEPAVDWRQQLAGRGAFTLALPQASQTHGGAEFEGFGLLAAGDSEGLTKAGVRFDVIIEGEGQQ